MKRTPGTTSHRRSVRGNLSSLWKRFAAHLPAGTGTAIGFSCLMLLGAALLSEKRPNEILPGILAVISGSSGLIWQGMRWRDAWITARLEKQKAERRLKQQIARHARQETERQETAKKRQEISYAKQRARESADARRLAQRQHEEQQAAVREARRLAESQEVKRILALPDDGVLQLLTVIFEKQALFAQPVPDEAHCDMLLTERNGKVTSVARHVPRERRAEGSDMRALEAWRIEEGAQNAYLIALAGFAPTAVRECTRLPIILVEAHLLAHWSIQSEGPSHDS